MCGIVPRRVHVDFHQGCLVRRTQKRNPPLDSQPILARIIESVSWVTEDSLWDHEWITETKATMKENLILKALHYNIKIHALFSGLAMVFSTNEPQQHVNNGTKVTKFRDTVNSVIELMCNIAFDGAHTSRACFLRAVTIFMCYAPDRDWKREKEMREWGVGDDRLARVEEIRGSAGRATNDARCN